VHSFGFFIRKFSLFSISLETLNIESANSMQDFRFPIGPDKDSSLKLEAAWSPEMVDHVFQLTWRYSPEGWDLWL
jgi:hypothetical protein